MIKFYYMLNLEKQPSTLLEIDSFVLFWKENDPWEILQITVLPFVNVKSTRITLLSCISILSINKKYINIIINSLQENKVIMQHNYNQIIKIFLALKYSMLIIFYFPCSLGLHFMYSPLIHPACFFSLIN